MQTGPGQLSVDEARERMVMVWSRIFERPVEPDTDFFADLEGDSRAAVAISHWVGAQFGVQVPMIEVFDHPTPAELTDVVLGLLA